MATARFEVDKLTGENDLWRIKMKGLLVQLGLSTSIDETIMGTLIQSDAAKAMDVDAKAHSAVLLSLGGEVF